MILSDIAIYREIEDQHLRIDPFDPSLIQPASLDLRLYGRFMSANTGRTTHLDPQDSDQLSYNTWDLMGHEQFILHSSELVLASTAEWIGLPRNIVGRVEGKSSLARLGVVVHSTAGFIDPGFQGRVTLELSNVSNIPIVLRPNMKIAQICFQYLDQPCAKPYGTDGLGSKYQNQTTTTASRYHENEGT